MFISIVLFISGFIFLIKGADIMIDGASSLARKFGISAFFIGLTVVAFGTSAPELVVSLLAGLRGSAGIALGNIIGSNISNTLLILGASAVIAPLLVRKTTVNKEIPLSLLAILAVGILVNDYWIDRDSFNGLTRADGLILILFFSIFIYYTFGITRDDKENIFQKTVGELKQEEPKEYSNLASALMIAFGLVGLAVGGRWIVNSAIVFARAFSVSEGMIGLTVVALGTSLPELAASAMAAYRGRTDIAVGNVVGSNIFNLLWVLGLSSAISTIGYDPVMNTDFLILISITVLLLYLIYAGRKNVLDRREGVVLLVLYLFYLAYIIYRG